MMFSAKHVTKHLAVILATALLLASCTSTAVSTVPNSAQTATSTATPVATQTATATATRIPPSPTPTVILQPSVAISTDNIGQLVELGRLRGGKPPVLGWSTDGQILAISFPGTTFLYDAGSFQEVGLVTTDTGAEFHIPAISPDGKLIAASGKLWSTETRSELPEFTYEGISPAFSADGKTLATVIGNTVGLWDVVNRRRLKTLPGMADIKRLAFSPDGSLLSAAAYEGVNIIDVVNGRVLFTLTGHEYGAETIAFSPDGEILASGGYKEVKLWDVNNGHELRTFHGSSENIYSVRFSPDGTILAAGGGDGDVWLWEVESGRRLIVFIDKQASSVSSLAFSPDGKILAITSPLRVVDLYEVSTGKLLQTLGGFNVDVGQIWPFAEMTFSPNGDTLAVTSRDRSVKLWDVDSRTLLKTIDSATEKLAFSPDSKLLAMGKIDGKIELWEVASGRLVDTLVASHGGPWAPRLTDLAFSPDGRFLAAPLSYGTYIWDTDSRKELVLLRYRKSNLPTRGIAFSPNGKFLAVAEYQGVRIWNTESWSPIKTFSMDNADLWRVAFSPDSRLLAATGMDNKMLTIWNVSNGNVLQTFTVGYYAPVGFSPNGQLIVSKLLYEPIIWDIANGHQLYTNNSYQVEPFAFSPDGKLLAVRSYDSIILLGVP